MTKAKVKKIAVIVLRVILVLLLIFNVVVIAMESQGGSAYMERAKLALLRVTGGSMEPVFHDGEIILTTQKEFSDIELGDIVVFAREDELITHTVIRIQGEYLITQGAANPVPDDPVSMDEYRAKVLFKVPLLGAIWRIYSSVPLFIAWMLLLIVLLFGPEIFSKIYDKLEDRHKNR